MIAYIVVGIIVVLTLAYFFLMFFYPEWVGISGEDTQRNLKAHQEEGSESNKKE